MMFRLIVIAVLLYAPSVTLAQETSDFTLRVFGGTDTTPPSTPSIQSVAPVTASQINISWSTSTDDFAVFGYVLMRDGVAIATTTALSYSDVGLAASTTYSYQVAAFDGAPNYSTSSVAVATTTLATVVPPSSGSGSGSSGGSRTTLKLDSLAIEPGIDSAQITIETNTNSRIELRIGTTNSYELAYLVGNEFKKTHVVPVYDLQSNTRYHYEVIGYNGSGRQTVLESGSFITSSKTPPPAPSNVSGLSAAQQGPDVVLSYRLPFDFPAQGIVRVVRSNYGYPQFLNDGVVVYEGRADSIRDTDVLDQYSSVFYTVFVVGKDSGASSGAVVKVNDARTVSTGPANNVTPASAPTSTDTDTTGDVTGTQTQATDVIQPEHFAIIQDEEVQPLSLPSLTLTSNDPFTVSIASEHVTGDFKTIVVTLDDPTESGKQFSFLLRQNGERSAYAATIAPLQVNGTANLLVEVFDYDARVISAYQTTVTFEGQTLATSTKLSQRYWQMQTWLWSMLLATPFLVLLFLWFVFWRRDR